LRVPPACRHPAEAGLDRFDDGTIVATELGPELRRQVPGPRRIPRPGRIGEQRRIVGQPEEAADPALTR